MRFEARDCSPLEPQPNQDQEEWLRRLISEADVGALVVAIGDERDEDEPIVYCERDGTWWAGRYVGTVSFDNHQLTILPRFGIEVLRDWFFHVTKVAFLETQGTFRENDAFVVQLLALVWARSFVEAARHGLPALRHDVYFDGRVIRGRLDVSRSLNTIATDRSSVTSVRRDRSLDNAVTRCIVAAYAVLDRWLGFGGEAAWLPSRARDLLPQLVGATGSRPTLPSEVQLQRVRYTPITERFRAVAELSRQIATRKGLASDYSPAGKCQGVLLDVAELWELYVLGVLRRAALGLQVVHGTSKRDGASLLESEPTGKTLGVLKPDALILKDGAIISIADAKYKRVWPTAASPQGPQREDLYQLVSYLSRYGSGSRRVWGALIYPCEKTQNTNPPAEMANPWILDDARRVLFLTLPHDVSQSVHKLRAELIIPAQEVRAQRSLRSVHR
jgi:5-methylcytosine-specific restriction enzyme subunit McrC